MKRILMTALAIFLIEAAFPSDKTSVVFHNNSQSHKKGEIAELPADSVLHLLGSRYCYVVDKDKKEIPSQITYDSQLIFPISEKTDEESDYQIYASDVPREYQAVVAGRAYPERADDVAWENEIVGFRVYGPATQKRGEKSFGYDIFLKHPDKGLVLERLYESQTSPANWHKVDSLKKIDKKLAKEFENSITYHIDHGLGMDCYAVGATLGDGVAALLQNDSISFPWCYSSMKVLDNGPLRFTAAFDFAPREIGGDTVVEHRIVSLDPRSHLNRCVVWFDGLSKEKDIVVGFPLRDDSPVYADTASGILAYADPTQGPDNGKAMLGVILDRPADEMVTLEKHALLKCRLKPGEKFIYQWGFAWDRADIESMDAWISHLRQLSR